MKTDTKWKNALAQNKPVFSRIYHAMGDETSKRLYESLLRLQYTGDVQYLIEAVQLNGFEPDPVNYEICCQKLQEQTEGALARNSKIIHAGVSDRCAVMCFHAAGSDESQFSEARGGVSISLRPIDQEIGERNISFLKLDVEGFELAALQGAEQAICR